MSKSGFKHEYLFVLGNGASIASADSKAKELTKKAPSIDNFIDVMNEIDQGRWNVEFQRVFGDIITDHLYNRRVRRVIEIQKEKKRTETKKKKSVSELLDLLVLEGSNDDIDKLIIAVFVTIISYYRNINGQYLLKLWEIVEKTKSPVISLNWDINFERMIYESLHKQIPMRHFFGKFLWEYLIPSQNSESYNPVVEILKPHGSLNWYFNQNDSLAISDSIYNGPWVDEMLHGESFLIPPLNEKEWKNWHGYRPRMEKIRGDINQRIRECASSTRTLVIVGYSFPNTDMHMKNLFADNRIENVWAYEKSEEVFQRIKGYFPQAKCEFKEGGFADILKWNVGEGL